ncbi:hypothetical protein PRUPE_3G135800 [Prunus persica]|uniref:CAAX prenyl protease 2/Lysostaphin resistance protein A-like domain-containing protein n=1 Tax=Prunus persica TaxID=3760 RepID=A0A251Q008_PRUPE|nr:hypothetical protein PRUPE_3G135800 [Prunus persica]
MHPHFVCNSQCSSKIFNDCFSILHLQHLELFAKSLQLCTRHPPPPPSKERSWLLATAIGFGFLFILVFLTSLLTVLLGPRFAIKNPVLKEIVVSSNVSKAACVLVYCIVTPVLEETIYRGFLLASISFTMKWQSAVLISSAIFSAAHLSGENSLQLFIIGCVLGCSYCSTGNSRSPMLIHSLNLVLACPPCHDNKFQPRFICPRSGPSKMGGPQTLMPQAQLGSILNFELRTHTCHMPPKTRRKRMAGFEHKVKERARELTILVKKGVKVVGDSCKKGWYKVKHIRR